MKISQSGGSNFSGCPGKPRKSTGDSVGTERLQFTEVEPPCQIILFVHDQPDILEARRFLFEALGYSVLTADCGNKALSLLRLIPIDVVVVDYPMRSMSCERTICRIREADGDIPIVLSSDGSSTPQRLQRMVDASVNNYAGPTALLDALEARL